MCSWLVSASPNLIGKVKPNLDALKIEQIYIGILTKLTDLEQYIIYIIQIILVYIYKSLLLTAVICLED